MAINDPYDRSGQYSGGDRGPKVEGYGGLAGQNPDRRDVAIGTLMGEGGPDNAAGYGAILDTIENRIGAAERFGGKGYGNYGQKNDSTLEGIVQARNGAEYNAWSPSQKSAYGTAQRGAHGNPKETEQGWYDQALDVYDDYYGDPQSGYRGSAMGGTFYQNEAALTGKQASYQAKMQDRYGALPVGEGYHVVTGPGYYGAGLQAYDPLPEEPAFERTQPSMQPQQPTRAFGLADVLMDPTWTEDPMQPDAYPAYGPTPAVQDVSWTEDPMQPDAYGYATPTETFGGYEETPTLAGAPQALGAALAQPDMLGSNGGETYQRDDGTVADLAGGYGGYDAFGPNDAFGGWGFDAPAGSDVADVALGSDPYGGDWGGDGYGGEYSDDDPEGGGWW